MKDQVALGTTAVVAVLAPIGSAGVGKGAVAVALNVPRVANSAEYAGFAAYLESNKSGLFDARQESGSLTPQTVTPTQFGISMQALTAVT